MQDKSYELFLNKLYNLYLNQSVYLQSEEGGEGEDWKKHPKTHVIYTCCVREKILN